MRPSLDSALTRFESALAEFRANKDLSGQAWVTDLKANLCLAQGKLDEAERLHQAAIDLEREKDLTPLASAWNDYHLANVELARGYWEKARGGFTKAVAAFERLGDVLGVVSTSIHLGEIACELKDYAKAESCILKAMRLVIPTQCKPLLADALTGLARLHMVKGEHQKALGTLMFVHSHPNCRQQTRDRMLSLAKALDARFSEKEVKDGFTWAKPITMEEMAAAWVRSLTPPPRRKKKANRFV